VNDLKGVAEHPAAAKIENNLHLQPEIVLCSGTRLERM